MQLVGANGGNGGNGRNTAGKEGISVKWETHLTQNGGNAGMGSGHILIERMKVLDAREENAQQVTSSI